MLGIFAVFVEENYPHNPVIFPKGFQDDAAEVYLEKAKVVDCQDGSYDDAVQWRMHLAASRINNTQAIFCTHLQKCKEGFHA